MIRHIVSWNYKSGFPESQNKENARKIKDGLESLVNEIDGIVELKVNIDVLPSSDMDIVLNSLFESDKALAAYQVHPEHKHIASFVSSVTENRVCIDYYEY